MARRQKLRTAKQAYIRGRAGALQPHFRNGMRCMAFGQIQLVSLRRPLKFTSLLQRFIAAGAVEHFAWPAEKLYFSFPKWDAVHGVCTNSAGLSSTAA